MSSTCAPHPVKECPRYLHGGDPRARLQASTHTNMLQVVLVSPPCRPSDKVPLVERDEPNLRAVIKDGARPVRFQCMRPVPIGSSNALIRPGARAWLHASLCNISHYFSPWSTCCNGTDRKRGLFGLQVWLVRPPCEGITCIVRRQSLNVDSSLIAMPVSFPGVFAVRPTARGPCRGWQKLSRSGPGEVGLKS